MVFIGAYPFCTVLEATVGQPLTTIDGLTSSDVTELDDSCVAGTLATNSEPPLPIARTVTGKDPRRASSVAAPVP